MKWISKFTDHAYALLRIVVGFMFAFHGAQKILGVLSDFHPAFGSLLWFAGLIELVCGVLVMVGFQTRWAAFLASGEMAFAYFTAHWKFQMGAKFFPAINNGELAVLYCFIFLFIACRGGVKGSVDKT